MGKFFITEFLNIECDESGYLQVDFKVEGDDISFYRRLESDEYYDWVMINYMEDEYNSNEITDDWENEEINGITQTFNEWLLDQHGEDTVLNFIQENVSHIEDLPPLTQTNQ